MDNGRKTSSKVLTTNDIRKQARDWTLAGDVGLLAHLEQFSENILNRTQETQNNFNELVDHYEELYKRVGNITNQFLALQNCQFVENRVYDEETPTEEKPEVKVKDEEEREKLLLMQYKQAVEVGIKILDTHFEEVQLPPNSDSDEEDDYSAGNSVIWKPKNPYASKKFPLLIGSAEWWIDDHVGLGSNQDGLDTEKIISESESELDSSKSIDKTMKSSSSSSLENIKSISKKPTFLESSSEDLFGFDKNENQQKSPGNASKGSSSLLEQPTNSLPDFEKDTNTKTDPQSQEQPNQINEKPKKVDNAFTRELLAKLVSVTNKNEKVEEKPRENPSTVKVDGDLFDETDDSNDLFSDKTSKIQEKIGVRRGLFDGGDVDNDDGDNGDDDEVVKGKKNLFSEDDLFKTIENQSFDEKKFEPYNVSENSEKEEPVAAKTNFGSDLFDDLDDDDMLFTAKTVIREPTDQKVSSFSSMEGEKGILGSKSENGQKLGWENKERLFHNINEVVDDDFFSSSGLFNSKVETLAATNLKSEEVLFPKDDDTLPTNKSIFDPKTKNSFDAFGFSSSKELSDKNQIDSEEDDIFSKSFKEEKKPIEVLTIPDDINDDSNALFGEKSKPPDSASISSSRSSLFDDASASKSRLASVFEKDKTTKAEDDLFNEAEGPLFSGGDKTGKDLFTKGREKGSSSLFDDWDDGDDLFGAIKTEDIKKKQEEGKKMADIMNDLEGDDLFKKTKPRETKSEIILKSEDLADSELFLDKPVSVKPKPPSSLSFKKKELEIKTKSVGKLNIPVNLKAQFESASKHISPGVIKPSIDEKEVLDEPLQASNLLKCPSKDRVKIPGRRRPQSRRARQEAIRSSGVWDEQIFPNSNSNATQPKDSLPSPAASNPLSPPTDEEDFFKVPELDTNFEREDQSIFKSDLFESAKSSKLDDNLLFDGAPVLSPLSPQKAQQPAKKPEIDPLFESARTNLSIFSDDVDDDNNYGNLGDDESLFKESKPSFMDTAAVKNKNKTKKSLFDLDEEEDDLFGGKLHVTPSKPVNVEKPKEGGGAKEKGNSSFVDPLGLMTKDE